MSKNAVNASDPGNDDLSFDAIESAFSGGLTAPPVAEPAPEAPPVVPPAALPKKNSEADSVETPETEPEEKEVGEEKTPESQQETDPESEGQEGAEGKPKKGNHSIDNRLKKLADRRREAERSERVARQEAADARARAERLERELESLKSGKPGPEGQAADGKPASSADTPQSDKSKPSLKEYTQPGGKFFKEGEDYDDANQRFQETYADWREEKAKSEESKKLAVKSEDEQKQGFLKDIKAAMDEYPDWEDSRDYVLANTSEQCQKAISHSPRFSNGKASWTEIVAHLADNPDALEAVNVGFEVSERVGIRALDRVLDSLEPAAPQKRSAAAPAASAPAPPKKSPTPPAKVGDGRTPAAVNLEEADMETFAREMGKYGYGPRS